VLIFFDLKHEVNHCNLCGSDNSDVGSTSMTSCSPRWIVHPNSRGHGGSYARAAGTQRQCLDACVRDSRCFTAEWVRTKQHCYIHKNKLDSRSDDSRITQFDIIRQCDAMSGTT